MAAERGAKEIAEQELLDKPDLASAVDGWETACVGVEAQAVAALAPSLINYCTFAASLAGQGDAAACVSRGVAAMLAARSTFPVTPVAPYTDETFEAADAVLGAVTAVLSAAARTPAVLQTSDALNPRAGFPPPPAADRPWMAAARLRLILQQPVLAPPPLPNPPPMLFGGGAPPPPAGPPPAAPAATVAGANVAVDAVLRVLVTVQLRATTGGAPRPDPDAFLRSLGGAATTASLGAALLVPRASTPTPLAAPNVALIDLSHIATFLNGGDGSTRLSAWQQLEAAWLAEGDAATDGEAQTRLQLLLDAAAQFKAAAATARAMPPRPAFNPRDPFSGAAVIKPPDDAKANDGVDYTFHPGAVADVACEAACLSEKMAKEAGQCFAAPFDEVARLVSSAHGVGPQAGKIIASNMIPHGEAVTLPSTLPAGRAAARTLMLSNTRDAISAERMAVAATAARVTATIDGAIRMHVADLKEVVVLYGGKRPGKRKSVVAGAAPAGTWGSADDCDSIQRSFMNFERIVWPLYEAIGMRAAERGRFRVEDSEEVTWADVPPRFGLALAFDTLRGRGLGSEAILTTLSEACEAMHIKAQRTRSASTPSPSPLLGHRNRNRKNPSALVLAQVPESV